MSISAYDCQIQSLIQDVKDRHLRLPELQRKYVWKSTQVRDFFDSLYQQYPTGELLVWETDDQPFARDLSTTGIGSNRRLPQLLLDGQQRLTSLWAVMTDNELEVRDKPRSINIVFNVFSEQFDVATAIHKRQPGWVSVTRVFTTGVFPVLNELKLDHASPEAQQAFDNLSRLDAIKRYTYRVIVLSGLNYDEVTDIFLRINSGGTRLGNADLALAQISSRWHGITKALELFQGEARKLGWELDDSILLRVLSAIATNQATLSQLFKAGRGDDLTEEKLRAAWERAVPATKHAIAFLKENCLIDRLDMMPTNYVLVPLALFFDRYQRVSEQQARDLQRWLYLALMWARYSTSSETTLDQDIKALGEESPVERMIKNIEDKVGPGRRISEHELQDQLSNSPFMVMAYVLARRNGAKDWFNGVAIGEGQSLEYHHIFPKAILAARYDLRAQSRIVNQVANLAFLSQRANARIAASSPDEYLPQIDAARLHAQNVPDDPALWEPERFEDFVLKRREMLANAINDLLASLTDEPAPWMSDMTRQIEARMASAETDLRELIGRRLTESFGPHAWARCVPQDIKEQVQQRIEQRIKRQPFEADQHGTLAARLAQCNFGDYGKIIRMNWSLFEDVFSDKTTFDRQMTSVQDARNALAHRRQMNEGEQHTAAGGLYWIEQCLRATASRDQEEESEVAEEIPVAVADQAR